MDYRHLADVRAGTIEKCQKSGSGYRVAPTLVLTAKHNITDHLGVVFRKIEIHLGHPKNGKPARYNAVPIWTAFDDWDVALLRVQGLPPYGLPVQWGRSTGAHEIRYTGLGFPEFAEYAAGARGVEQLSGIINPLSTGPRGCFPIDQSTFPDFCKSTDGHGIHSWSGISGAAVFSDRLLIGVATFDDSMFGGRRLHATPVEAFFEQEDFARLLQEDLEAEPTLESIELHKIFVAENKNPRTGTPGSLLAANRGVVAFHGRQDMLDELNRWRDCPENLSFKLIVAEGGQGKTRLAREFLRLTPSSWVTGFLRPASEIIVGSSENVGFSQDDLIRLSDSDEPVLIAIDYAESDSHRIALLVDHLVRTPPRRPIRLLLLARSAGAWWANLRIQFEQYNSEILSPDLALPPLADTIALRRAEFDQAISSFAELLVDLPDFPPISWPLIADQVRANPPEMVSDRSGNALTLHMVSLIALLRAASGQDPSFFTDPEEELLIHERSYLHRVARRRRLLEPNVLSTRLDSDEQRIEAGRALDRALAGAILIGPCDKSRAFAVGCLGSELHASELAAWLGALYPPSAEDAAGGVQVAAIQPDRLAERLVGQILIEQSDLLSQIAPLVTDATRARESLITLARAAARPAFSREIDKQIEHLISTYPDPYASAAQLASLSVDRSVPLIKGLLTLGGNDSSQLSDHLREVADALPYRSISLTWFTLNVAKLQAELLKDLAYRDPEVWLPALATALHNLSIRLGEVDIHEESLSVVEKAVKIYRDLAEDGSIEYRSRLAGSLVNLSKRLSDVGRWTEGLKASQEAVAISRKLIMEEPGLHLPDLSMSLSRLSVALGEVGRYQEGLEAGREAVVICRNLVIDDADAHSPALAESLVNLSLRLGDSGKPGERLEVSEEAVAIYRDLSVENSDAWLPVLARALHNLSADLAEVGRVDEGLAGAQEVVTIYRALAEAEDNARWLPALAMALDGMSVRLGECGDNDHGLIVGEESVAIYRGLIKGLPNAYLPDLARALNNLAVRLNRADFHERELTIVEEAVAIYRGLVEEHGSLYLSSLVLSLSQWSIALDAVERRDEGLDVIREAVAIQRVLADRDPGNGLPGLAQVLVNLSAGLVQTQQCEEGIIAAREAVAIHQALMNFNTNAYLLPYIYSLVALGRGLIESGRPVEAVQPLAQAFEIGQYLNEALREIIWTVVHLLNQAYHRDAQRVAEAFQEITGIEFPWLDH